MTQVTAKKSYIKDADGSYVIPYVNPADNTNLGVVKPDGTTITVNNGIISTNNKNMLAIAAYASNGELLTDSDGLAFVKKYAHSTFDVSKFTVVGSPTITDDGIVSGFSGSNYLTIGTQSAFASDIWELYLPFKLNSLTPPTGTQQVIFGGSSLVSGVAGFRVQIEQTDKITFNLSEDGQAWRVFGLSTGLTVEANKNYIVYFKRENDSIIPKLSDDGGKTWTTGTPYSINYSLYGSTTYGLGSSTSGTSWVDGSIDLKQFSITVDGVEVFSGNRTGIDTIKPDDYTVVGTPTISADGIASGFSTSNYLTKIGLSYNGFFECELDFTYIRSSNDYANVLSFSTNATLSTIILVITKWNDAIQISSGTGLKVLTEGERYRLKMTTDCLSYIKLYIDDVLISERSISLENAFTITTAWFGVSKDGNSPFNGSIDLNSFKIYVDGNLVYQPCLKIPYTWSKTGSKIVASIYRDRVNDMASQFGFAPYYTLSDTDFTLPQVELYGLIGAKTLRDSYENGINKWYLYSNRDLEQQGSCTSGVEVTLPKPFADTNYILTVPYSAKSATAFTPTQTGDWYAKGKGIL